MLFVIKPLSLSEAVVCYLKYLIGENFSNRNKWLINVVERHPLH